ncbi:MAG TPA: pilus assembly protein N-terminal domain-containing protein [Caulobacteraceae bacterium]|nr:pilus assembly protein N-terminal domain-containing protein [Caulobacteraceae bacterium]
MRSLALASILALAPAAVMAASLGVPLNQSVLVSLPAPAHNVFLGNPTVADVSVSDQRHVVVTGKAGGVTNLIVTDEHGRTIFDRQIVVGASAGDRVSLINGGPVVSYACAPVCEQVGDAQSMPAGPPQPMSAPAVSSGASAPVAPRPSASAAPGISSSVGPLGP